VDTSFIDLAPINDPDLVPGTVATALGLPAGGKDLIPLIAARLSENPVLLILDNCEQVVDAVAVFCEALFEEASS
jgi:predicted ATPase